MGLLARVLVIKVGTEKEKEEIEAVISNERDSPISINQV